MTFSLEQQSANAASAGEASPPWLSHGTAYSVPSASGPGVLGVSSVRDTSSLRFPRDQAERVLDELRDRMRGTCTRWEPAGSFARGTPDVGDIEIVYVSQMQWRNVPHDLFAVHIDMADDCITEMLARRVLVPRLNSVGVATLGCWNKLLVHAASGIPVDMFKTTDVRWYNYLVCRTGGKQNNIDIASAAIAKGLTWQPYSEGFFDHTKQEMIRVHSQEDVYRIAGLPYIEPHERS